MSATVMKENEIYDVNNYVNPVPHSSLLIVYVPNPRVDTLLCDMYILQEF